MVENVGWRSEGTEDRAHQREGEKKKRETESSEDREACQEGNGTSCKHDRGDSEEWNGEWRIIRNSNQCKFTPYVEGFPVAFNEGVK